MPFQLAFLLLNLPGLADPRDPNRATVDLLFFPTGGGKTEAYSILGRSGRRTTSLQNSSKHVPRSQDYSKNTIPRLIELWMEAYDAGIVHQTPPGAGVSDVMTHAKIFGILIFSSLAATGATLRPVFS